MKKHKMNLTVQLLALIFIVAPLISFPVLAAAGETGYYKAPASVTVPAGTHLMVNLDSAIDSRQHKAGHKFTATLEGDIVANNTVVPLGEAKYTVSLQHLKNRDVWQDDLKCRSLSRKS